MNSNFTTEKLQVGGGGKEKEPCGFMIRQSPRNFGVFKLPRLKWDNLRLPLPKFGISRLRGPSQCVRDRRDHEKVNRDRRKN